MKKLIAIAAVVVAGGVFASNYVYDFTATLKTTKAKSGTVTVNLGKNAAGQFWYNDTNVTAYIDTTKTIDGIPIPTISTAQISTNIAAQAAVLSIASTYNVKSAGKWCETYRIPGCYRITGTQKYTERLENEDCCSTAFYGLTNSVGSTIAWSGSETNSLGLPLFQRFGSSDSTKANKAELYAAVVLMAGTNQVFNGWLAGQGTMATRNNKAYINSINGNIVGTLLAPECENCCAPGTPSVAFDCLNTAPTFLPFTAGYGTFNLKINNNLSTF